MRGYRKNGTWWAEWSTGVEVVNGKKVYRRGRKAGFRSKGEAQEHAATEQAKHQPLDERAVTVEAFVERWLVDYAGGLEPNTQRYYKAQSKRWIVKHLGAVRLRDLKAGHITDLYTTMRKEVAEATVLKVHRQLKLMLRERVEWSKVRAPKAKRAESYAYTPAQVAALLAKTEGSYLYPVFLLAGFASLAKSEVRGLQWRDLEGDRLSIRRTRQFITGYGDIVTRVKRERRARVVILPPFILAALEPRGIGASWLFPASYVDFRRDIETAFNAAGIAGAKLHPLRHFFGTRALAGGASVADVSAAMGHATPYVTLTVYAHEVEGGARDVAAKLADVWGAMQSAPSARPGVSGEG